jgi:cytochrome c oxidase subunit IV
MAHEHHGDTHGHHAHKPNRKEYWVIFLVLFVLTVIEVGITYLGLGKSQLVWMLVFLAVSKAAIVALFYMHLKHETRGLKLTIAIPLSLPGIYALVLIAETASRLLP